MPGWPAVQAKRGATAYAEAVSPSPDFRISQERFRATFDFAPVGIAIVGLDGRWLRVNRTLCDLLGYSIDDLLASDFQTIPPPTYFIFRVNVTF